MKVLFIGLGSIGKRHLRLLKELGSVEIIAYRSGTGERNQDKEIKNFADLNKAINDKPDFAIIANPTSMHVDVALELAKAGIPFLIEKPVSDRIANLPILEKTVKERNLPAMVGYQLRFHPGYQKLREIIQSGKIGNPLILHGYAGQYLPEWRPDTDYRQSYSAKEELGGGVILDLSHEIDLAVSLMGTPISVACLAGRCSQLDIETEDFANLQLRHEDDRYSFIHLNYLERSYTWWTRVTGIEGSVLWDYSKGWVQIETAKGTREQWKVPDPSERDILYLEQLKYFLDVLSNKARPLVDLSEGITITKIAVAAKKSAQEQKSISLEHFS